MPLATAAPARAADDAAPERVIRYENDALTVRLVRAPVTEVLNELEQQTGATVRGSLLNPSEVSADFKDGVLTIMLPKPEGADEQSRAHRIEVKRTQ